jgi:hypothetical protein
MPWGSVTRTAAQQRNQQAKSKHIINSGTPSRR